MELVQVSDRVFCLAGPTNIGVVVSPDGVAVLIDSGLDSTIAKRVVRDVSARGWKVGAVINTHAHADHTGGNAEVKRRTGCEVWAPRFEEAWIREPVSEPLALFAGARPPSGLLSKFTLAEACQVDHILEPGEVEVCGIVMRVESLKGHSPNQMGIAAGGVLFCGDAFFQPDQLSKHVIPYNVDIGSHLETLHRLLEVPAAVVVPGHGGVCDDPKGVVEANLERVRRIEECVLDAAGGGATSEDIVSRVCSRMGVTPGSVALYYLMASAIHAYLSHLESEGRLRVEITDVRPVWGRDGVETG
ncbi:MAG: MBL fold metallo-hydrolase [Ignavibacteriales bacterium]